MNEDIVCEYDTAIKNIESIRDDLCDNKQELESLISKNP